MCKRVASKLLALLEEIDKAGPHILLLNRGFWDVFDSLAVADNRSRILVLLLESVSGILVDCLLDLLSPRG